jgi:hypothetical protein
MKKRLHIILLILVVFSVAGAQDLTLEDILAKYYKTMGFENLQGIKTIVMTGTIIQQDAMPVKIVRMRPDHFLMEFDIQDITACQGYDGQTAWWTTPWTGNPKPQPMPEDRAKDLKSRADFDGLLYNWKQKGHIVELVGRDTVEKALAYKLKVTKNDGGIEFLFIDSEKFTLQKRLYYRKVRGQEVAMENFFRDYRTVGGAMFSYTQETWFGGQPYNSVQFDNVELNIPVDDNIFHMPAK